MSCFDLFKKNSFNFDSDLDELFFEEKGDGNFSSVYLILVFAIAALALILVVKPLYQNAQKSIPKNTGTK